MTATPPQGPVVRVKPQPTVYTLLLVLAILFLVIAAAVATRDLMTTYGLSFGQLFQAADTLP